MPSMEQAKFDLTEAFGYLESWQDRYAYIIELGRQLAPMPESLKVDAHLVKGCQSRVWLVGHAQAGRMQFQAASDAVLVTGLLAVVLSVYNDQSCADILSDDASFIEALGLSQHLSPTRSNGLHAVLRLIQDMAQASSRASE